MSHYPNAVAGAATISLPAGTYTFAGQITDDLTISGADPDTTIVDGGGFGTVFTGTAEFAESTTVFNSPSVAISGVTVRNSAGESGGGISNVQGSTLTLTDSTGRGGIAITGGTPGHNRR